MEIRCSRGITRTSKWKARYADPHARVGIAAWNGGPSGDQHGVAPAANRVDQVDPAGGMQIRPGENPGHHTA